MGEGRKKKKVKLDSNNIVLLQVFQWKEKYIRKSVIVGPGLDCHRLT